MFYSDSMLTKKGPLANIWLAAHWDRKLTKAQIVQTDINESVNDLIHGNLQNMALRLSGQLLLGVSKIYDRKARYLLEDCSDAVFKIKTAFKSGVQVDLPAEQAKASVAAITLTAARNVEDLMMPDLDLNLDEILREATMAQQGNKVTTMASKPDLKKALAMPEESGHVGFGPVQDINEIPGGQFGDLDIEFGRRLTDPTLRPSDPFSIEQGRRESGVRDSEKFDVMQFSPLRTPTKDALAGNPFDAQDNGPMMDDDYGWVQPDHPASEQQLQMASDGVQPISPLASPATKKTLRKRVAKKGTLVLDERTEITNAELQTHLRNTEEICEEEQEAAEEVSEFAKAISIFDLPLFASFINQSAFSGLFKATASARASRRKVSAQEAAAIAVENNAPMMDDDYGWMGPDHENQNQADAENQVPDVNSNQAECGLSGLQSPLKRLSISGISQTSSSQSTFSRATVDTLTVWQAEFSAVKNKTLRLEDDLMAAMAGPGAVTKRVAASAFFEALVLRGKGLVAVRQEEPFAPITVHAKPGLFSAIACEQP